MNLQTITTETFDTIYPLLETSFPKEERKSYTGQKQLLQREDYHFLAYRTDALAAYYEEADYLFIEHLAVRKELQNHGIGSAILQELQKQTNKIICLEVELPVDTTTRNRIHFYQGNHFYLNDMYEYALPPLEEGYPFVPLILMTTKHLLSPQEFANIKKSLYNDVYRYTVKSTSSAVL